MIFNITNPSASGIYQIINTTSNKVYVGSAYNLYNRYRGHKSMLNNNKHDNDHLQKSFNKHGSDSFAFSIIEYCDRSELSTREEFHIKSRYGLCVII